MTSTATTGKLRQAPLRSPPGRSGSKPTACPPGHIASVSIGALFCRELLAWLETPRGARHAGVAGWRAAFRLMGLGARDDSLVGGRPSQGSEGLLPTACATLAARTGIRQADSKTTIFLAFMGQFVKDVTPAERLIREQALMEQEGCLDAPDGHLPERPRHPVECTGTVLRPSN